MGTAQIGNVYKSEQDIANEFQNVYLNMQPKTWKVLTASPTIRDLNEREVVLFKSTDSAVAPRVYTKFGNVAYFINLSNQ